MRQSRLKAQWADGAAVPPWAVLLVDNGRHDGEVEDVRPNGLGWIWLRPSDDVSPIRLGPTCNSPHMGVRRFVVQASRKPFWYDELLTFHVSSLHPFSLLWRALQAGVDGMPLGYYVFVQLARILPGDPHVTLRLPSILGYLLTLLGVYWFARKRLPAFAGLAAVFLDNAVSVPRVCPGGTILLFAGRFPRDIRCPLAEDRRKAVHDAAVCSIPHLGRFLSPSCRRRNVILRHR